MSLYQPTFFSILLILKRKDFFLSSYFILTSSLPFPFIYTPPPPSSCSSLCVKHRLSIANNAYTSGRSSNGERHRHQNSLSYLLIRPGSQPVDRRTDRSPVSIFIRFIQSPRRYASSPYSAKRITTAGEIYSLSSFCRVVVLYPSWVGQFLRFSFFSFPSFIFSH